jgi:hypothetical protein
MRTGVNGPARVVITALFLAAALSCAARAAARVVVEARGARAAQSPAAAPLSGATLEDYRSRVGRAARQLEELAAFCEELERGEEHEAWSGGEFDSDLALELPAREENALVAARRLLPASEKVSAGGALAVNADNRWLHEALDEYARQTERLDNGGRAALLGAAVGRLRSLEAALAPEAAGGQAPRDKDAEKGRLARILAQPDFDKRTAQGGALRRLVEEFVEWAQGLLPEFEPLRPGTGARVSQGAQYLVFGLCFLVLAYVGWRLWSRRTRRVKRERARGPRVVLGERLEEDQTAADLLAEAENLARAGDARAAIRKAYVALLVELGERRLVRLARHKTNRDYLRSIREAGPPRLHADMLPLTLDYELHWYGLRPAGEGEWVSFRERCRQALKQSGV